MTTHSTQRSEMVFYQAGRVRPVYVVRVHTAAGFEYYSHDQAYTLAELITAHGAPRPCAVSDIPGKLRVKLINAATEDSQ